MTLQKQLLALPIVGGLDEKSDALLSARPQQMTNCLYRKTGAVSKRYGYECIGPYNTDSRAQDVPEGELLTTYRSELVRIGGGKLATHQILGTTSDWITRGSVPECLVRRESAVAGTAVGASSYSNPTIAYASGYVATAYAVNDGATYRILFDLVRVDTGARVFFQQQLYSDNAGLFNPKVVALGDTIGIFWTNNNAFTIQGRFLDISTMQIAATATVASSLTAGALTSWDVDVIDGSHWLWCAELNAGINRISYQAFSQTISGGAFTPTSSLNALATTDIGIDQISIRCIPAVRTWISYALDDAGTTYVKVATVTPAYANETAPFVLDSYLSNPTTELGLETTDDEHAIVLWNRDDGASEWAECNYTGTVTFGPRTLLKNAFLTRPLSADGRFYALTSNLTSDLRSQFIIDLHRGVDLPLNGSPRIAAVTLPSQLHGDTIARSSSLAGWASLGDSEYLTVSLVQSTKAHALAIAGLRVSFSGAWTRTACETSNLLAIGGGALSLYDGAQVFEASFAYAPDAAEVVLAGASGGSMTPSTIPDPVSYGYKFVYAWTDAQGNTHRSAPSQAVSIVMGTGDTKVTLHAPCLHLTNKDSGTSTPNITVEVYRTKANGATYFYITSLVNVCSAVDVSYDDVTADTAIDVGMTLYTDGQRPHVIPAGGNLVLPWKGCLLLGGTDDDSVWISGEVLVGDEPWFALELALPAFEGGRVTALSILDSTPIIFKADATYYIDGEPPPDLGPATMGSPRRIQTEAGCSDPASVVTTPMGLIRMARTGLYLLDRALADQWIGRAVEDSYRSTYAGAALLPAQGLVRWLQRGTTGARDALNYDYYHAGVYGTPVWSRDELYDVQAGGDYANADPVACAVWNGAFVWLSAAGYLYRETSGYLDTAYDDTATFVPMTFETGFEKAAGVAAYQRVRRVYITGERRSINALRITLTTDVGVDTRTWSSVEVAGMAGLPVERATYHAPHQKCQWMKVKITDSAELTFTDGPGTGEAFVLRDITLELGVKQGGSKLGRLK